MYEQLSYGLVYQASQLQDRELVCLCMHCKVWNVSPVWHTGEVQQLVTLDNAGAAGAVIRHMHSRGLLTNKARLGAAVLVPHFICSPIICTIVSRPQPLSWDLVLLSQHC
jgi:hypothetical protein